jgi:hypothetical protein
LTLYPSSAAGPSSGILENSKSLALRDEPRVTDARISLVQVFSATKNRDRDVLGERVSAWMAAHPQLRVVKTVVRLSSDRYFHCLTFVLFCAEASASQR